jgi:hypothetical protein
MMAITNIISRTCTIALIWLLVVCLPTSAVAFHDGGSAQCGDCHVTHGAADAQPLPDGSNPLLIAPTATDVCLLCHGGQDGVFGNNPLNPPVERGAGNFVFLLEDNVNDAADGLTNPIAGESCGHSVISLDYGVGQDTRFSYAPGGNFPSSQLGCTSCHDPHGNDEFRMLNGVGPVQDGLFEFNYPAPQAIGLDITNPLAIESPDQHTAYLQGMSDWCGNCHGLYHDEDFNGSFEHDSDETMDSEIVNTYNQYNGASDPHGGFSYVAYLPDVAFENTKSSTTSTAGATNSSRVMCLTCHRAHASSAPHAGRWDFNIDRLDEDGLISGSWPIANPYNDSAQGQLCYKCHGNGIPD